MIWPFRPRSPLPLAHKVKCERRFAAVGRFIGRRHIPAVTVVTPADLDPIIADCDVEVLPGRLFAFAKNRFPFPSRPLDVRFGNTDNLTIDGQPVYFNFALDDDGHPVVLHFHPELAKFPYRLAAVAAGAVSECFSLVNESVNQASPCDVELLPVLFGFGPVMANATLHESDELQMTSQRTLPSRFGNTTAYDYGYCMALADWSLSSDYEGVASSLRLDAREGLVEGLRYLRKSSDCSFERDFLDRPTENTVGAVMTRLREGSDSVRLSTLIDMTDSGDVELDLLETIAPLLHHREIEIRHAAAVVLGQCEELPQQLHDDLAGLVEASHAGLRRAAISALRPGFKNDDGVQAVLKDVIDRADAVTAMVCIQSLLKYDSSPFDLSEPLLKTIGSLLFRSDTATLQAGLELLNRTVDDPAAAVRQHFSDDPSALVILDEALKRTEDGH